MQSFTGLVVSRRGEAISSKLSDKVKFMKYLINFGGGEL
jgi:hypothetical protein